jgi:riboflavin synthase alpha subunit
VGDPVNLEVDILAKYVEKLLSGKREQAQAGTFDDTLRKHGYL